MASDMDEILSWPIMNELMACRHRTSILFNIITKEHQIVLKLIIDVHGHNYANVKKRILIPSDETSIRAKFLTKGNKPDKNNKQQQSKTFATITTTI